jgi:RNA polymerase II elongation factor ELL
MTNTSRFLAQNKKTLASDTTRSLPTSPALAGVNSPSLSATSVPSTPSVRSSIVHELAAEFLTSDELLEKIKPANRNEFSNMLDKLADEDNGKFKLRQKMFKELDVFNYKYGSSAERQRAIDNAIRAFDKMRMGTSEPEWEKLMPKSERGTGKILSKIQSKIAEVATQRAAPKVKKTPATPNNDADDEADLFGDKSNPKAGGESMSRSISQPPATKSKKISEKEAQAKRLLGKPSKARPAPAQKKAAPQKFLSAQFVNESDEEEDTYMVNPPVQKKSAPAPKPTAKRSREDTDVAESSAKKAKTINYASSSSSSATKHRMSDASRTSQSTNTTSTSYSTVKKSTSPQKSSPLASSPPTNASDIDEHVYGSSSSGGSPLINHAATVPKRKAVTNNIAVNGSSNKRQRMAAKFRDEYRVYLELHRELEIAGKWAQPEKVDALRAMRDRLVVLKEALWRDYGGST